MTKKKPTIRETRVVKRACHQCRRHTEKWDGEVWRCVNDCGPKGLADLLRF